MSTVCEEGVEKRRSRVGAEVEGLTHQPHAKAARFCAPEYQSMSRASPEMFKANTAKSASRAKAGVVVIKDYLRDSLWALRRGGIGDTSHRCVAPPDRAHGARRAHTAPPPPPSAPTLPQSEVRRVGCGRGWTGEGGRARARDVTQTAGARAIAMTVPPALNSADGGCKPSPPHRHQSGSAA